MYKDYNILMDNSQGKEALIKLSGYKWTSADFVKRIKNKLIV